jgi:peptide/nickel transport system permease protein
LLHYLARRVVLIVPLLLGITFLNFVLINLAPGDPITAMLDPMEVSSLSEAEIEAKREALGLDDPLPVRYALWLKELATGNLGHSIKFKRPVAEMIAERVGNTIRLTIVSLLIAVLVGVALGVLSAVRPYSLLDYGATAFAFVGVAMPGFFFALLLIYVFSLRIGILPTSGMTTPGADPSLLDRAKHMVLPVVALAYGDIGSLLRYTRGSMLETLHQDYVTTGRAKGLPEYRVILRHAFGNALIPLITVIGLHLPALVGGAFIIEAIFNWPGMGTLMLSAVTARDYTLLMGGLLVIGLLVLVSNLLADVAYAVADPRIRYR